MEIPALVAGDPVEPGEQAGLEAEAPEAAVRFEEDRLEDVLRLERIADRIDDHAPNPIAIRLVELPERGRVAALGRRREPLFAFAFAGDARRGRRGNGMPPRPGGRAGGAQGSVGDG